MAPPTAAVARKRWRRRTTPDHKPGYSFPLQLLLLLVVLFVAGSAAAAAAAGAVRSIGGGRSDFPEGFLFGTASSAYQYEGAAAEGGRGPSIWDTYSHSHPERIKDGSNGDVAVDSYHRYKEDVKMMKEMGMDAYRFSISWTRILPNGSLSGGVNQEGVKYYNNLIDELLNNGIRPFVTLFHWDTPQGIEDRYRGFMSPRIVEDFEGYAGVCFREFGDRVKQWTTFNEPTSVSMHGYGQGTRAPGRCSAWFDSGCGGGDSSREPYIVAHNILLSHARAVLLYRSRYQEHQKGEIGIVLSVAGMIPYSDSASDVLSAQRSMDFQLGWFMDPLSNGNYPSTMRELVGDRLPKFSSVQSGMLKGSFDFVGFNYYTTFYSYDIPPSGNDRLSAMTDKRANLTGVRNGIPIGRLTPANWLYIYPQGIRDVLVYAKRRYNDPIIYITENGVDEINSDGTSLQEALEDDSRINYFQEHLRYVQMAIWDDGVNVKGYFAWSLLDNYEWQFGYADRFGLVYVDYEHDLKRYPKSSARWFRSFLCGGDDDDKLAFAVQ